MTARLLFVVLIAGLVIGAVYTVAIVMRSLHEVPLG